ncbi:MAG: chemotaxis protein, partial [Alphaproteobacteria bacterium]
KGFAVVAGEVKALANETARATEDIRARIDLLSTEMSALTEAMAACMKAVDTGKTTIDEAGADMRKIGAEIETVSNQIAEIASNISEQSIAVEEIGKGVSEISRVTDRNSRNSQSTVEAVGEIERYVESQFQFLDGVTIDDAVLFRAKSDHFIWKKRLAEMLVGVTKLSEKELADHHQCRLGKWYDQVKDPRITAHAAFAAIATPHEEVHRYGKRAAKLFGEGQLVEAKEAYDRMSEASKRVVAGLDELIAALSDGE